MKKKSVLYLKPVLKTISAVLLAVFKCLKKLREIFQRDQTQNIGKARVRRLCKQPLNKFPTTTMRRCPVQFISITLMACVMFGVSNIPCYNGHVSMIMKFIDFRLMFLVMKKSMLKNNSTHSLLKDFKFVKKIINF